MKKHHYEKIVTTSRPKVEPAPQVTHKHQDILKNVYGPGDDDYGRKKPLGPLPDDWKAIIEMFEKHPPKEEMDKCVNCGKPTHIPKTQNIDTRSYYVEGAGQLCEECYVKIYGPRMTNP